MAALLGRDHANWLTFGQWASAEARESIDGTAVPPLARPFSARRSPRAVAGGNAAIFGARIYTLDGMTDLDDRRLR